MKIKSSIIIVALLFFVKIVCAQIDSIQNELIYSWKINKFNQSIEKIEIDTSLYLFQNYNPILEKTITANYLGNMGSPTQLNVYYDRRKYETGFIFSEPYGLYFHLPWEQKYYNTKRQYTLLEYSNAGPKDESEQLIHVLHTQNVNKDFNVGVNYDMISSDGRYFNQQIRQNNITLFSSYKIKGYKVHANYNLNRVKAQENGGIDSLWYLGDNDYRNRKNIPVKLEDAGSHVLSTSFYLNQEYNFGKRHTIVNVNERKQTVDIGGTRNKNEKRIAGINSNRQDSLSQDSIMVVYDTTYTEKMVFSGFSLSHQLTYNRDVRKYFDETLVDSFYNSKDFFISSTKTDDQVYQRQLGNRLSLNYRNKGGFNISMSYFYERINYLYKIIPDTNISVTNNGVSDTIISKTNDWDVYNSSVSFYMKGFVWEKLLLEGYSEYYFKGEKKDNSLTRAKLSYTLFKDNEFGLIGNYRFSYPDFLYRHYSSNHYQWNNSNLKTTVDWDASAYYKNDKYKLFLNVRYGEIKNYLYLDSNVSVSQFGDELYVFAGELSKKLNLGPVKSFTRFTYQKVSNDSILNIPEYNLYQSLYFERLSKFKNTGGELLWQIGVDYRYNSAFMADAYSPVLGLFHRQYENMQEDFHCVDVFINVAIKRMRLYFKYNYINSALNEKYYFNSPYYPSPEPVLQFGLGWTFYD